MQIKMQINPWESGPESPHEAYSIYACGFRSSYITIDIIVIQTPNGLTSK